MPRSPYASANVEEWGAVLAAKNAIDGGRRTFLSHGAWRYASWGINRQEDAAMKVDFGRKTRTGKAVLYIR